MWKRAAIRSLQQAIVAVKREFRNSRDFQPGLRYRAATIIRVNVNHAVCLQQSLKYARGEAEEWLVEQLLQRVKLDDHYPELRKQLGRRAKQAFEFGTFDIHLQQ